MKKVKKFRWQRGFSLFESMVALLIIGFLTIGVSTGIHVASNIYTKSVFHSEGEVLAATIDTALSDILRFSTSVKEEDGMIRFTNANYSMLNGHVFVKDGWLYLNLTGDEAEDASEASLAPLVSGGMYTSMKITSFTLEYNKGLFSGTYTIESKKDSRLKKTYDFYFRTLSE